MIPLPDFLEELNLFAQKEDQWFPVAGKLWQLVCDGGYAAAAFGYTSSNYVLKGYVLGCANYTSINLTF